MYESSTCIINIIYTINKLLNFLAMSVNDIAELSFPLVNKLILYFIILNNKIEL